MDTRVAPALALQRRAGNQAVASLLHARTLQRLTAAKVKSLTGDEKTKYEAAKAKYDQNLGVDKPLYDYPSLESDGWGYYVDKAETVDDLVTTIDKLVSAATAWKARKDERTAAPPTPAAVVPTPSKVQTTQPQPPKQRKRKAPPRTAIVLGEQSYAAATPPPALLPPAELRPAPALPPKLNRVQKSLDNWNGTDHVGRDETSLTLEEVQQVVAYVRARWAAKPFKGPGSGIHEGKWQLKISELKKINSKSATWHLTVSKDVYDDLRDVPERGATSS